jgi:hypothetical protein
MAKKKRGRPRKSDKEKAEKLANASKIKTKKVPDKEPEYSFDTESVILMGAVGYWIRKDIEDWAVENSKDKHCIPRSKVVESIKNLGLDQWRIEAEDADAFKTI